MRLSTRTLRWLREVTVIWGVIFAVVHLYWAAGGNAGMNDDVSGLGASLYVAFIAVLGLVGTAVAHGLERPWGARVGAARLRALARAGGIVLFLGVVFGVGRWAAEGSLGDDGAGGVVITAYFLLGAALFAALGWGGTTGPERVTVPAQRATRRT